MSPFDLAETLNRYSVEASARAEQVFTIIAEHGGLPQTGLTKAVAALGELIPSIRKRCGDDGIDDDLALLEIEIEFAKAFHVRLGELISYPQQSGRA